MKKIALLVVLLVLAVSISSCAKWGGTPDRYVTTEGVVIETTENMAVIMATRDSNTIRATAFSDAVAKSDRPDQVVALTAGYFSNPGQRIERGKTWDERALPWAQLFLPYYNGMRNRSGESTVAIDGNQNTVYVSKDTLRENSSKEVGLYPTSTHSPQTQVGTEESVNGEGTFQPDNSHDNEVPESIAVDPGLPVAPDGDVSAEPLQPITPLE